MLYELYDHFYRPLNEFIRNGCAAIDARIGVSDRVEGSSNAVLVYHSVGESERDLYGNISVDRFRSDLTRLSDEFELVDLPKVLTSVDSSSQRVAITFDDGYRNFFSNALPVIREFDVPVTMFVTGAHIGDRDSTAIDEAHNITTDGSVMMSMTQLAELVEDPLVTLGNHTYTHPHLTNKTLGDIRTEIETGKRFLETNLDIPVDRFSYPYGNFDEEIASLVGEYHELAVTTHQGLIRPDTDRLVIPRIHGHNRQSRMFWELCWWSDRLRLPEL